MDHILSLLTLPNLITLAMLILLQAVLGFDNLLYISIESRRVAREHQSKVRQWGIGIAIVLRIVLLFALLGAIEKFQEPIYTFDFAPVIKGTLTFHSLIILLGGVFIIYTAVKEIFHMLVVEDLEGPQTELKRSVSTALFWIISMNLVFSFDSILSAIALTDVFEVMAIAIILSGILMIWLADRVSEFLQKNRMYEVLGLFILFLVGILLLSEGGEKSQLVAFGYAIEPMAKSTFYFVLVVLILVDIVQSRYRKKLLAQRKIELEA